MTITNTKLLAVIITASTIAFASLSTAAEFKDLIKEDSVYTLVNLHPDEERRRLYTVNYQLPAVLPVCTEVKLTKLKRKTLIFQVPSRSNREYQYLKHKSLPEDFGDHLSQIFGKTCPKAKIAKMSKKDQDGIKAGKPLVGMTKAGVIIAMGPPPTHVTYSTDLDEWMYWQNRFGRLRVEFSNGKVSKIVD
ncbi:MAG: hypothetical protein ACRBCS_09825 [Cellvibrionaceae bacterium]